MSTAALSNWPNTHNWNFSNNRAKTTSIREFWELTPHWNHLSLCQVSKDFSSTLYCAPEVLRIPVWSLEQKNQVLQTKWELPQELMSAPAPPACSLSWMATTATSRGRQITSQQRSGSRPSWQTPRILWSNIGRSEWAGECRTVVFSQNTQACCLLGLSLKEVLEHWTRLSFQESLIVCFLWICLWMYLQGVGEQRKMNILDIRVFLSIESHQIWSRNQ